MICKNCRQYCPDGGRFCLYCGKPLEPDAPAVVTSDSVAEEPKRNSIKFSGTASESPKSTVKLSGGVPISQSNGSFQARRDPSPAPQPPTPVAPPAPRPTPVITPPTPDTPPKPQKKRSVGLILLLILLILSVCGLIGVLLYHFGVIGDKSTDETTAAQTEAAESISGNSNDDQTDPSTTEPEVRLRDGEVLLSVDPAPLMAYAKKMMSIENLDACYLYDIDGDGLCEMILRYGRSEADMVFDFYTYRNGLLYIGQLSGGHSYICIANGQLSRLYGQMGYEELYTISLENGAVCEELTRSSQLPEGVEYTSYPEPTAKTDQKDLNVFAYVYAEKLNQVAAVSDHCEEKDGYFSDGRYAYQLLPDGTLWYVDGVTGIITIYGTKIPDYTTLFGVTENSLYFQYADPENWWGVTVYALGKSDLARTDFGSSWNAYYKSGYVILTSFRSDVSPSKLKVIDQDDRVPVSDVTVWTVSGLDGYVYYFTADYDAYANSEPYTMTGYRLDSNGSVKIAEFSMGKGGFAYFQGEETLYIAGLSDGSSVHYNIRTGETVS